MRYFFMVIVMALMCSGSASAIDAVTTCDELKELTVSEIQNGGAKPEAIMECIERGEDPPLKFRKANGTLPIGTTVGNTYILGPCRPSASKQCPNNSRRFTDGDSSIAGFLPANTSFLNPNKDAVPWGNVSYSSMPCGAIAAMAKNALAGMLGKAEITSPISLKEIMNVINLVNGQFSTLQSTLNYLTNVKGLIEAEFNKRMNQLDGQLGLVLNALSVIGSPLQSEIQSQMNMVKADSNALIAQSRTMSPTQVQAEVAKIDNDISSINAKLAQAQQEVGADPSAAISNEDMSNRVLLTKQEMAAMRSELDVALGSAAADEAKAMNELNKLRSDMDLVTNAFPAGLSSLKTQVDTGMNFLGGKVSELINKHATAPQDEINNEMALVNNEIDRIQGYLSTAVSFVGGIQSQIDGGLSTLRDAVNRDLDTALVGAAFKHKDCSDGKFWGVLNNIFTTILQPATDYVYDNTNNTFYSASTPIIVTMPVGTTLNFNLSNGAPKPIIMPFGGTLYTQKGQEVSFGEGTEISFRTDGVVSTSNGNQFRVDPRQTLKLYPNDAVQFPAGTKIPVDPKGKVYPAAAATHKPAWLDDYIKQSAPK